MELISAQKEHDQVEYSFRKRKLDGEEGGCGILEYCTRH